MSRRLWPAIALAALSLACGEEDPGDKSGPVDEDGDGTVAADDCDDSDAAVYPGAEDAWYDGVDSDCAGDDDFDADGDGVRSDAHGGADCDDADPAVSPAATEVWYDGVDQDCRGDNDYDADVDGFDAASAGGDDCDDNEPTTYPGAADTWYDGVDSNCDGASDADADADGFDAEAAGGLDCDDTDDTRNPDATEVWYDGIDEDCDGADDYDADGDGATSDAHGGNDCNDTDPDTYSGAPEQLDGHDSDCDGTADHYTIEGSYGGTYILGAEEDAGFGSAMTAGDADGDAYADLVVAQARDTTTSAGGAGLVHLFYGSSLGTSPTSASAADETIATVGELDTVAGLALLGDTGGDGFAELVVGTPDHVPGEEPAWTGAVWIFDSGSIATATTLADADVVVQGAVVDSAFGAAVVSAGDLDGDGVADLVVGAPGGGAGAVTVWLGGGLSGGTFAETDADARWTSSTESTDELGAALSPAGDMDGDGRDDVLVGAPGWDGARGAVLLLRGSATPTDGTVQTRAAVTLEGEAQGDRLGEAVSSGDLDGDGTPDIAAAAPSQTTRIGRVHLASGATLTTGTSTVSDLTYADFIGGTTFGYAGTGLAAGGDVDADGRDDLVIGGPGDSSGGGEAGAAWIEISGRIGSRALADADATFDGGSAEDRVGASTGLADIDGDGKADALIAAPGEDNLGGEGAVYIGFSGW